MMRGVILRNTIVSKPWCFSLAELATIVTGRMPMTTAPASLTPLCMTAQTRERLAEENVI
jgi:hypothetical protein